jgi:hypothetical protein
MVPLILALALTQDAGALDEQFVKTAVQRSVEIIIERQENYEQQRRGLSRKKTADKKAEKSETENPTPAPKAAGKEWPYEGVYRLDGEIPPGYRVGGTAICCWALLEAPGFEEDGKQRAAFDRGLQLILDQLTHDPLLASGFLGTYDVRGWAHAYGLALLLRALALGVLDDEVEARVRALVPQLVRTLEETEIRGAGGWNYSRPDGLRTSSGPSTFMTAPTLQILFQARAQGFAVKADVVKRALDSLEKARLDNNAFQYQTNTEHRTQTGFEAVPGACARMAICETTLYLAGRGSVARIRAAIDAFFDHWDELEKRRKQNGTHEPPYMIAPYYFHYGHTYIAQAIEQLPEEERPARRQALRALYVKTREEDGGWNDRVFPRSESYGSAMAILGLLMPSLPPPARWETPAAPR